jgi:hypothetical protein
MNAHRRIAVCEGSSSREVGERVMAKVLPQAQELQGEGMFSQSGAIGGNLAS